MCLYSCVHMCRYGCGGVQEGPRPAVLEAAGDRGERPAGRCPRPPPRQPRPPLLLGAEDNKQTGQSTSAYYY